MNHCGTPLHRMDVSELQGAEFLCGRPGSIAASLWIHVVPLTATRKGQSRQLNSFHRAQTRTGKFTESQRVLAMAVSIRVMSE